ncbi:SPOR domain-containing protein, partial [Mesorhizobium sp. M7A.F.Ca.MR.362.00.0.0]
KVQIGAFSSKDNADTLAARAKNAGFDAIVILES